MSLQVMTKIRLGALPVTTEQRRPVPL